MERQASHNCDRSSKVNSRVGRLPGKVSQKWESGKASWKGFVEGPDSVMIIISPHLVEFKGPRRRVGARSGGGRAEGAAPVVGDGHRRLRAGAPSAQQLSPGAA